MQSKENATKMVMMTTIPQWIICSCCDFFANLYMYNFSIILWSVGCKCQIYGTIIQKRFSSLTIPLFCLVCFFSLFLAGLWHYVEMACYSFIFSNMQLYVYVFARLLVSVLSTHVYKLEMCISIRFACKQTAAIHI